MNRSCSCGGRLVPMSGTAKLARFICDKCGCERTQRKRQPGLNRFELAIMDMAKSYGLGTPESRAIVSALDHARAVTKRSVS